MKNAEDVKAQSITERSNELIEEYDQLTQKRAELQGKIVSLHIRSIELAEKIRDLKRADRKQPWGNESLLPENETDIELGKNV